MRLLNADEIEVKVKQVKENGLVALLYKTARTDMDMLDEEFGAENWQDSYEEIKGNMYCKIGVWFENKGQWVWKQDCGIESREDDEGNQKKGEASDAFKRAGFKWGIGRELYTAPFIWISSDVVQIKQYGQKYSCNEKFAVSKIGYNDKREIIMLEIVNSKGKTVFTFGSKTPIQMEKPTEEKKPEKKVISTECQRAINDADTMVALRAVYDKYATLEPLQDLKDACAAKKELLQVMLTMG